VRALKGRLERELVAEVALTISTPLPWRVLAAALEVSRVTPRILYWAEREGSEREGSERTKLATEPPCWPVAPKTTRSLDMVAVVRGLLGLVSGFLAGVVGLEAMAERLPASLEARREMAFMDGN
jgi:hypothetical protein